MSNAKKNKQENWSPRIRLSETAQKSCCLKSSTINLDVYVILNYINLTLKIT